jgi:hypothetical protein
MVRESTVLYPSPGRCIYCGDDWAELSDEHIIPYSLDGHLVIDDASCSKCAKFTCRAESKCLNGWMKAARVRLKASSRRKIPTALPLRFRTKSTEREEMIATRDHPSTLVIVAPPPPSMLWDMYPSHSHSVSRIWAQGDGQSLQRIASRTSLYEQIEIGGFDELSYARMMAKIAHSYATAILVVDGFVPLLLDLILERTDEFSAFVGGDPMQKPKPLLKHQMQLNRPILGETQLAVVAIQLFAKFGAPVFQVVVGKIKRPMGGGWAIYKDPSALPRIPVSNARFGR